MKIRKATRDDIEQLVAVKKPPTQAYRDSIFENQLERLRRMDLGEVMYLVAEDKGNVIAHLLLTFYGIPTAPEVPNISDLYVSEEARNKGVGSLLIQAAEKMSKEHGYALTSIAVNPTLNPRAQALYERLGYRQTPAKPFLDGLYDGVEDWVVTMVKDLV